MRTTKYLTNEYLTQHEDGTLSIYSGLPEFGYELIATLPFAYSLHKKGLLRSTTSAKDTSALYFFSENHYEIEEARCFDNVKKLKAACFPNINIHQESLDWEHFCPPPLKEYYKEKAIKFDKETIVITNRKNMEWAGPPVNFLGNNCIISLFDMLQEKYQIVYIDPEDFGNNYEDHAPFVKSYLSIDFEKRGILNFKDLRSLYPTLTVNEVQLRLYAGASKFISSNGGLGIFCSYFGGENIIYSRMAHELDPDINSFYSWYYKFAKTNIAVTHTEEELVDLVRQKWVDNQPFFNILIRTSGRPNYFHDCVKSIQDQSYKNYRILVSVDDVASTKYVKGHPCAIVEVDKVICQPRTKPDGDDYGIYFPFNSYFGDLLSWVNLGFVIYLDDDDRFLRADSLQMLSNVISELKAELIFWRVVFPKRIVPSDENWSKRIPVCRDMSTIGYCHSAKYKPKWEPWKRADYRAARYLSEITKDVVWLNEKLTGLQREKQDGYGKRDDKLEISLKENPPFVVVITAFNAAEFLERCLDSIFFSENKRIENMTVLVGVDGCRKTLKKAQELTRRYQGHAKFYFSRKNVGTYILKNSLLHKIVRRDSLVLFFDADDIITPGFLNYYYELYNREFAKHSFSGILRVRALDIDEELIASAVNYSTLPYTDLLDKIRAGMKRKHAEAVLVGCLSLGLKGRFSPAISAIALSVMKVLTMGDRARSSNSMKIIPRAPHGVFFCSYRTLEAAGFFNSERVGQDTDFQERIMKMNLGRKTASTREPWFIRSVHKNSLTCAEDTKIGSIERDRIAKESLQRIESGMLVAEKKNTSIEQIL
ncbi:Glycosyl transferase family 2 [Thiorhodovibrio winogradskyi]|uniref:Glycosyl transferase family 2 n=1 Tax=Thiorhodovibrio winogradskyi TaxID=77007 RepID=A0ABZ0SF43_9GAMM|nr:glycosyltransferase [Thiorhodovibrio winogradskyi]